MTDLRWRNFQESRPLLKTEESGVHAPTSSPNPRTNKQCSNIREVKTGPVQVHRYCFLTSTWCTRNNPCDFRKMSLVFGRLEPLPQKYNRVFCCLKIMALKYSFNHFMFEDLKLTTWTGLNFCTMGTKSFWIRNRIFQLVCAVYMIFSSTVSFWLRLRVYK